MGQVTLPLEQIYAPIREDLQICQQRFDAELVTDVPCVNQLCERLQGYRGKMLRPALLLCVGRAAGGDIGPDHHTLGAVVEIVHMATLVHDDVLDGADERRRQQTINSVSGNVAAVLLGDYLISHAFHLCSSLNSQHASRRIGATTNIVCEGELLQNHHSGHLAISESVYFDIIRRKTGALTAVSCELGAYASEADEATQRAMYDYGMAAGVAFQIIDDVLDVIGQQELVGKTLGLDLNLGKATLPVLHCLAQGEQNGHSAISAGLRQAMEDPQFNDASQLRTWLQSTGSIEYAINMARRHVGEAVSKLDVLPPSDAKTSLTALAEFIVAREF